jgi:hypothetical protein
MYRETKRAFRFDQQRFDEYHLAGKDVSTALCLF